MVITDICVNFVTLIAGIINCCGSICCCKGDDKEKHVLTRMKISYTIDIIKVCIYAWFIYQLVVLIENQDWIENVLSKDDIYKFCVLLGAMAIVFIVIFFVSLPFRLCFNCCNKGIARNASDKTYVRSPLLAHAQPGVYGV
ncbi:hypothetical protein ADUPG1_006551 [Aduncisulcus paluster]|uniref:Uncharacterized protein n=1 Tax=Aduncisulcus paluster TaxID=2918883 RepID=A0ABQ5KIN5_9EUKA|nr:hypothetical protein ADUPG1_006551 [Aduncisulcus paluster]